LRYFHYVSFDASLIDFIIESPPDADEPPPSGRCAFTMSQPPPLRQISPFSAAVAHAPEFRSAALPRDSLSPERPHGESVSYVFV